MPNPVHIKTPSKPPIINPRNGKPCGRRTRRAEPRSSRSQSDVDVRARSAYRFRMGFLFVLGFAPIAGLSPRDRSREHGHGHGYLYERATRMVSSDYYAGDSTVAPRVYDAGSKPWATALMNAFLIKPMASRHVLVSGSDARPEISTVVATSPAPFCSTVSVPPISLS